MARDDDFINRHTMSGRCDVTPLFVDAGAFSELISDLLEPFDETAIDAVAGIDALGSS
jgi:adenine/guanine phosphoribosyltransferase-like PRPP-binding protein